MRRGMGREEGKKGGEGQEGQGKEMEGEVEGLDEVGEKTNAAAPVGA